MNAVDQLPAAHAHLANSPTAPPEDVPPRQAIQRVRHARRQIVRRHRMVLAFLAIGLLLAVAARTLLGDYTITVADFFRIMAGHDVGTANYILLESKLPRAVLGILVGAAFGLGGGIFQSTLRNPLASPDIIGVSFGASASAVFTIVVFGTQFGGHGWAVSAAAVCGAVAIAVLVRWQAGSGNVSRLVLSGIGVSAALQSVVHYLFTRADEHDLNLILRWLTGSLNAAAWPTVALMVVALAVIMPVIAALAASRRVAELGSDVAMSLGLRPARSDALLLAAVVLVAIGVAAAGPIAFVAFLAGPIARALNGGRTTVSAAGLTGAVIVVAADHVAAYLIPEVSLPVGVVTGAFGAPFLIWLLATGRSTKRSP